MSDLIERLRNTVYAKPTFPICARSAMLDAADALEAKDKRIAELEAALTWFGHGSLEAALHAAPKTNAQLNHDIGEHLDATAELMAETRTLMADNERLRAVYKAAKLYRRLTPEFCGDLAIELDEALDAAKENE